MTSFFFLHRGGISELIIAERILTDQELRDASKSQYQSLQSLYPLTKTNWVSHGGGVIVGPNFEEDSIQDGGPSQQGNFII